MAREEANILKRLRNEYESAMRREKLITRRYDVQGDTVSDQAAKAIHYNVLKREVETNRNLYETMLQKLKEAGIAAAIRASNIRILVPARLPEVPYKPKPGFNAVMGLIAGLFLSVVFVFIREHTDRRLKSPGQTAALLNLPEFGAIPSTSVPALIPEVATKTIGDGSAKEKDLGLVLGSRKRRDPFRGQQQDPVLAESFRATLASLFLGQNGSRRVLVFTSPGAREGKTTLVSNLGLALANSDRRVLIIDGDIRRPRLHGIFGLSTNWGLGNILEEEVPVKEYPFERLYAKTQVPRLYVLPSGSGEVKVASMRYHGRLTDLFLRFRFDFDAVLVDTPPMLEFSDARLLGHLSDGVVMVIRAGETTLDDVVAGIRRLQEDGTPVLGTILNDWNPKHFRYGYSKYGAYQGFSMRG
jgi:capsular exopolysaccharide synthesis family protein